MTQTCTQCPQCHLQWGADGGSMVTILIPPNVYADSAWIGDTTIYDACDNCAAVTILGELLNTTVVMDPFNFDYIMHCTNLNQNAFSIICYAF